MSGLLPVASFNLALEPFVPTQAIDADLPVTVHLTLAAIDPNSIDDDEEPSTLRILKSSPLSRIGDESDSEDEDDEEADSEDDEAEEDEDEDDEEMDEEKEDQEEGADDEDDLDEDDLDDDDVEEHVICTLSPKSQFQQTLDFTISPDEEIFFVVTGSYPMHLTGNYVEHPYDDDEDDYDSDEDAEDYDDDIDSDEYDLTPDEDELAGDFDINDLEDESDIEGKIEELVEEDDKKEEAAAAPSKKESKKAKKENKKRQAEEQEEEKPEPKETKKQKKAKEDKNVQFNKELEQGPTKSEEKKKPAVKTLAGGVTIEDRTVGKGPVAKNGSKIGMRYIGKLKNGSVFDKNTSGKPFQFTLGKGEVIKGWDIGVAGMAAGGERRIVIPAPYAYGKKKLPGIPANSELTFDVKLVSLK